MTPILWTSLRDWYFDPVSGLAVTKNIGSAAPTVQLGDGATVGTFPTQLGPSVSLRRGMTFNTGDTQYLRHLTCPAFGANGTAFALVYFSPLTISQAATHVIMESAAAGAGYATGILLAQSSGELRGYWNGAGVVVYSGAGILTPGIHSVALANDGSICHLYIDGKSVGTPAAGGGAATATGLFIGGDAAFSTMHSCDLLHASVWPFGFTAQQDKVMHSRLMAELST